MITRGLKRRLIAGFGASTFSRLSTTLTQIFSVPVFLSHWGVHLYGEWILLNTIPSYLGLSDVAFGSRGGQRNDHARGGTGLRSGADCVSKCVGANDCAERRARCFAGGGGVVVTAGAAGCICMP